MAGVSFDTDPILAGVSEEMCVEGYYKMENCVFEMDEEKRLKLLEGQIDGGAKVDGDQDSIATAEIDKITRRNKTWLSKDVLIKKMLIVYLTI